MSGKRTVTRPEYVKLSKMVTSNGTKLSKKHSECSHKLFNTVSVKHTRNLNSYAQ